MVPRLEDGRAGDSDRTVPKIIRGAIESNCMLIFLGDRLGSQDSSFKVG